MGLTPDLEALEDAGEGWPLSPATRAGPYLGNVLCLRFQRKVLVVLFLKSLSIQLLAFHSLS